MKKIGKNKEELREKTMKKIGKKCKKIGKTTMKKVERKTMQKNGKKNNEKS